MAVSGDAEATQAKWRKSLGAPYPFIADTDARIISLYDVKTPLLKFAKRATFVIGQDGVIREVFTGAKALDPTRALNACG